jgi:hypothetical protein
LVEQEKAESRKESDSRLMKRRTKIACIAQHSFLLRSPFYSLFSEIKEAG